MSIRIQILLSLLLGIVLAACQPAPSEQDALTIYSGRSKALVDPLVEQFEEQASFSVDVRYGKDAQLLSALQEEGEQSPADLFWANTTGALGAASEANLLASLPDSLLNLPGAFTPQGGEWVPITARFRVLAYNTNAVDSSALPRSVWELPEMTEYEGRIGWTPAYSSFQDFVTAMRTLHGPDSTRTWLEDMQELDPEGYTSNTPMILALADGEIDLALTNHYYVLRLKHSGSEEESEEPQPGAPVATYHFAPGDVGNLALVTGAGQLQASQQSEKALRFLRFLLSSEAQHFAASEVHEYPVVEPDSLPDRLIPVDRALRLSPSFDFEQLRNMDETLSLMREVGLL